LLVAVVVEHLEQVRHLVLAEVLVVFYQALA
jgi:hypothetical protein